ncbi:transposase [Actinomadura nitritigenes]|uniref:transposase n=1 Tax=Actinomadura nitritigenes TaxID=134602 RepID=UPI003D8FA5C9
MYVLTSGCAWRHLPAEFGVSPATAHRRFIAWTRASIGPRQAANSTCCPTPPGCRWWSVSRRPTPPTSRRSSLCSWPCR